MDERAPGPVRPILERYLQLIEEQLPGLVEGLYLHGSIALDAFNPRRDNTRCPACQHSGIGSFKKRSRFEKGAIAPFTGSG